VTTVQLGALSGAQYLNGCFSSQSIADNIYSLIKALTIGGTISLVALYYGFKARGGPVGVGNAVARAMIVNLVLIHVIAAFWSAVVGARTLAIPRAGER
jgi:phospholipid/cholesterol/gamma-HCH transport system permease protein